MVAGACKNNPATMVDADQFLTISRDYGATWTPLPQAGARRWYFCAVSHDGSKAVFAGYGSRLWAYDVASNDFDEITDVPETTDWSGVAISPDGAYACAMAAAGTLYRVSLSTGALVSPYGSLDIGLAPGSGSNLWALTEYSESSNRSFYFGSTFASAWPGMSFSEIRITNDVLHTSDFTPPTARAL